MTWPERASQDEWSRRPASLESGEPDLLPGGAYVFPVCHCGAYVLNTHRNWPLGSRFGNQPWTTKPQTLPNIRLSSLMRWLLMFRLSPSDHVFLTIGLRGNILSTSDPFPYLRAKSFFSLASRPRRLFFFQGSAQCTIKTKRYLSLFYSSLSAFDSSTSENAIPLIKSSLRFSSPNIR